MSPLSTNYTISGLWKIMCDELLFKFYWDGIKEKKALKEVHIF